MSEQRIAADFIAEHNSGFENAQKSDYQALGEQLAAAASKLKTSLRKLQNILSLFPRGGLERVVHALAVSPVAVSRAGFSTNSTTVRSSTNFHAQRQMFRCIFRGIRLIRKN